MTTVARGVRLEETLDREIGREAERRGKSRSALTAELLEEAVRMRRAPGIVFVDGATGRRPVLAGTGLDVWGVVAAWRAEGESFEALRENYPWLAETQLRAALSYYRLYPAEIDARLEREASWTPEARDRELPFARPLQ